MKINIRDKYLIFPVNTLATKKVLMFNLSGETAYKLNIKLDNCNPDFYAYVDVSRFIGQTVDILVSPEMKIEFRDPMKLILIIYITSPCVLGFIFQQRPVG